MGFFDRFAAKKSTPPATSSPAPAPVPATPEAAAPEHASSAVLARLAAAREKLEFKDKAGALAIYEEVLAAAGDRADVLVTISGDLGETGHIREIIDLIAPRYDGERHGPATGLNLLQAYLHEHDADAAQHVLDILFALNRPDLEQRLYGFSNAIAELIQAEKMGLMPAPGVPAGAALAETKVSMVSISKPIWFYGLEPLAEQVLPPKTDRLRRIGFAQLAVLGVPDLLDVAKRPEEEIGRLSRALPLWFAETFYFSPHYAPIGAVGLVGGHYALFGSEWNTENIRQLVDSTAGGLDYLFTGAIRKTGDDYEVILRVWEIKKMRERKQLTARWNAATADAELAKLHEQVRLFMEWSPEKRGLTYVAPVSPRAWLEVLGASVSLFLHEKNLLPKEQLAPTEPDLAAAAAAAPAGEAASLAFIALRNRAEKLSLAARLDAALAQSPLIAQAAQVPL